MLTKINEKVISSDIVYKIRISFLKSAKESVCGHGRRMIRGIRKLETAAKEIIVVNQNGKIRYIAAKSVIYIESYGRKVLLHLENEVIEYYAKISQLEAQLEPGFFRVHRAYLVNLGCVLNYSKREAKMRNQDLLLISKYRFAQFQKAMRKYAENACKMTEERLK